MSPYALEAVQELTEMGCPPKDVMELLPKSQSQVSASTPFAGQYYSVQSMRPLWATAA